MPERGSKTSRVPAVWARFGIFFSAIQIISCGDWWPWTKAGYITMTRRQSNNQWSGGIVAHPTPKIPSAKIRWESSYFDLIFLGSRRHPPHWLSSKGPNYQRGVLLVSAGAIGGHYEGKTPREGHQGGLVLARQCRCSPDICNLEETGHIWASSFLITHTILRVWPLRTTTCSLDWKKQLKISHFSSDAEVIAAAETRLDGQTSDFFLSDLHKLEQRDKTCIELRGEYVE